MTTTATRTCSWRTARTELQAYLDVYSADEAARLELAESFFKDKDSALNPDRAVNLAIKQLQFIRRESPIFPAARVQEARMWLFSGLQPSRANTLSTENIPFNRGPFFAGQFQDFDFKEAGETKDDVKLDKTR